MTVATLSAPPRRMSGLGTLTLADITRDAWTVVATSGISYVTGKNKWIWRLTAHDVSALHLAREAGRVITTQARVPDGFELRARGW